MEILFSIGEKIAEYTMAPIGRQAGYMLFYKDNFKELKDQVEELKTLKERIEHDVEAERKNGREIEADVQNWLNDVDEILEEANQLCEDPRHMNVRCCRWSFPNLKSRHQLSRNAKKMTKNIAELQGKGKFDRVGYLRPLHIANFISAIRGSEKLESRNIMREDIMLALKDPKISKIGVYGLSGVGKTTLVKEVVEQVKADKLFDAVVMTTVSQTLDLERIQGEIADQLGLHFEEMTTVGRAGRLHERIKKEKTILIILDDIWEKIDLAKLGIPLEDSYKGTGSLLSEKEYVGEKKRDEGRPQPFSHSLSSQEGFWIGENPSANYKGCKLLLTSRNQNILLKNETQRDFRLEVLNDVESWNLFQIMVGDTIKDANLQNIATQVAQRCAGLPVLIVTMAKSLKNKNIHYWKDALNNLNRVDNGEMDGMIFSALEFSYNRLEDDEVKEVFLLCGVHGTSIFVSDLLKYVIGLGVFKHLNTIEDARNKLHKMIGDLKASCLLLDNDVSTDVINMHDIVCEVAISIGSRDQYVFTMKRNARLQDWPSEDFLKRCTQIILICCCIQKLPKRLDCPNLKIFHLNSSDNRSLEIPNAFFEGMENLEVLDLKGMIISLLPTSLASLTKLKTLSLDQCFLKDMIGIGALKNLEILSFIHSSMEEFSSEIGQLTHLRMLDLKTSGIEVIPPNIISKLTKLEELYMGDTLIKWDVESLTKQNKNASLAELRHLQSLTTLEIQIHEAWILPRDIMFEKLESYKIVIGDKWEWSDRNTRASRLLKLKLDTSIHLEHGIKTLIKRVEDLYLDEMNGISNVLFQLNGEGFPLLKYLHIQNNGEIQHIINSTKRNQTHVLFPKLETLILHNLNNLEKICHGPLTVDSFGKLRVIKIKSCGQLKYVLLVSMVKEFFHLVEIEVSESTSVTNIVFRESLDNDTTIDKIEFIPLRSLTLQHLPAMDGFCSNDFKYSKLEQKYESLRTNIPTLFFDAKVSFPNLETLKLSSLKLNKIWDGGQHSIANSFQNLANLIVEDCGSLKYLFSPFMVENLKNLKRLEISKCHMMEEIIATEGRNDETAVEEVRFSKLEEIVINDMKNLKAAWHYQFDRVKTLEVNECEKLDSIFPSTNTQKEFGSLETLKIRDCALVEEIFQLTANGMHTEKVTTQLKNLVLHGLPKLKQIWNRDPQGILRFFNLQAVQIEGCENLEYVFPFSIAKDLPQLEDLHLKLCGIKEVVLKKDGPMEETAIFELNHLTSLNLAHLDKLKRFYAGAHTLECQSLKKLFVFNCKELKLFDILSNRCQGSSTDQLHFSMLQPLFTVEEVIGNLEELMLNSADANMILQHQVPWHLFYKLKFLELSAFEDDKATFPHCFLKNVPNLEGLFVANSSFKEIFHNETLTDEEEQKEICTRLKQLVLWNLPKLEDICREGCQIHPVLEVLEVLHLIECSSLRNLVPSSVIFCHLTNLMLANCNSLLNLITSSTARSLIKLEKMKLTECNSLEEIVIEEVDETKDEIAFSSLEILELDCLPRLHSFSSSKCFLKFPLLEEVVVRQCPRMKVFSPKVTSTPKLRKVLIEEKVDGESYWEGDLNGTINKMFLNKVAFCSFKHLELLEYPELKELWYGQVGHKLFCNLKSLVVKNCHWLSNILLSLNMLQALSNLEVLEVRDCDTLEAVFDLDDTNKRAMVVRETISLKVITLCNLPKLKYIWKHDSQEIVSFGDSGDVHAGECQGLKMSEAPGNENKGEKTWSRDPQRILRFHHLQVVTVEDCEGLEYLFPFAIAMDLQYLEVIVVKRCRNLKEIVANEEAPTDETATFVFNHLFFLELGNLQKLERFYAGNYNLACQSLKRVKVYKCYKLELFMTQSMSSTERGVHMHDEKSMGMKPSRRQPLFMVEEVIPNLEVLGIGNAAGKMILVIIGDSQLRDILVWDFLHEQAAFPDWLLHNVSNLKELKVENSSFKKIFRDETMSSSTRVKDLILGRLPQLQYICKEGCQIDPILEVLESLNVNECSSLINLVPSSAAFYHLTSLEVTECNGLVTLITSSTARSLVKLKMMKIRECNSLEQILTEEGDETEEEISFSSLDILELECLPKLIWFCSIKCLLKFPLLEKIVMKQCPRMKVFSASEPSTPNLQKVLMEKNNDEDWYWKDDLNGTIKHMFLNKVAFCSFKLLKLSEYPELKELWCNQLQVGNRIFTNLKVLVVHKCDFLSYVLISSNLLQLLYSLEELEVRDCDSLEAVFDVKVMDDKEMHVKEASQLKKLVLSSLPNLKRIWNKDPGEILSFKNLQVVRISKCQNLKNLFSVSLCQDLQQLEELNIESCGVEEIVAIEEEGLEEFKFDFPQLTLFKLIDLTQLKRFYPGRHTLECPSLKNLNIHNCEILQIFAFSHLDSQQALRVNEVDMPIQQALFSLEKVSPNLKVLTLNEKDFMRILNGHYEANLFHSIEMLCLQCFQETPIMFQNKFLERFPNTTLLHVRYSSFKILFPSDGIYYCSTKSPKQIKTLGLFQLEQLSHIWNDDSLSDLLERLLVWHCPSLTSLGPPSISFTSLISFDVNDCKGLTFLITPSTAKSLVHLVDLRVANCEMMEEVVMTDEGIPEEIMFESLQTLKITSLPGFKSFCTGEHTFVFPSLEKLIVTGCPKMQNFSSGVIIAPDLTAVEVENERRYWTEDLNTTIKQLVMEKEVSNSDQS